MLKKLDKPVSNLFVGPRITKTMSDIKQQDVSKRLATCVASLHISIRKVCILTYTANI